MDRVFAEGMSAKGFPLIARYAKERNEGEHFGDFVVRAGVVAETKHGNQFHDDIKLAS